MQGQPPSNTTPEQQCGVMVTLCLMQMTLTEYQSSTKTNAVRRVNMIQMIPQMRTVTVRNQANTSMLPL